MKIFKHIANFIKSPIYKLTPEDETRIVLDNFKEYWNLQMEFAIDDKSKKCTSEDYHPNEPGYITPDREARIHFFKVNGPKTFAELYTYKERRLIIVQLEVWFKKDILKIDSKTGRSTRFTKFKPKQHFHKKAHSN